MRERVVRISPPLSPITPLLSLADASQLPRRGSSFPNLPLRGRGTAAAVDEGRCGREWYVFPHRSRPLHPSSVSLTRASSPGGEAFNLPLRGRGTAAAAVRRAANRISYSCQWQLYHNLWKRGVAGVSGTYFPTAPAQNAPPQSGLRPASSPVGEAFFPQGKVKDHRSSKYRSSRSRYRTASSPRGLSVRSRMARL